MPLTITFKRSRFHAASFRGRWLLAAALTIPALLPAQSGTVSLVSPAPAALASLRSGSPEALAVLTSAVQGKDETLAAQALAMDLHPGDFPALLNAAAEKNAEGIIKLLIDYGADAYRATTALRSAVEHKNAGMATALLEAGADPNLPDAKGVSPLRAALGSGQLEMARVMFQHGGYPDDLLDPALDAGDIPLLTALFECGLSPNRPDSSGENLLVRAVIDSRPDLIRFLLEKGADATRPGLQGQPALHMAAVTKNMDALKALLDGGADPNQAFLSPVKEEFLARVDIESFKRWLQRDTGLTLLMLGGNSGNVELLKTLLEKGAKRGQRSNKWKRYPVVFACDNDHIPAAQILLGRTFEPGETPHRVVISLSKQKAMLYKGDELVRTSRVSTGRKGYATPKGKYVITDKARDWVSTIYHVAMPYFMRLNCRDFGMHAGVCPGYPASHGCIRMPGAEVKALFAILKIGDQVTIEE